MEILNSKCLDNLHLLLDLIIQRNPKILLGFFISFFATLDFACAQDGESEAEFLPDDFEEKPEREKKHANFTLCNVCNIQLNSTAQAQIHYNGKSHQKRLKQLSNGMLKNDNGKLFKKYILDFISSI